MYSFGFVDQKYTEVSRRVAGGTVVTAPYFDPTILELTWNEADYIYIDLHGRLDQPRWLFASGKRVICYEQIKDYAKGKVIFATTCYLPGTAWFDTLRNGTSWCMVAVRTMAARATGRLGHNSWLYGLGECFS